MKFTPNLVVGVAITILGAVLLLDRFDVLELRQVLHLWPILLTLFGISVVVQAWKGDTAPLGSAAGRPMVGPGFVLFLVVTTILATRVDGRRLTRAGTPADSEISVVAIMGRDDRVSTSTSFRRADMTTLMGRSRLDLRHAVPEADEVVIDVFGMWGATELLVPPGWTVDVQAWTVAGGVEDKRRAGTPPADAAPASAPAAVQDGPAAVPAADPPAAPRRLVIRGGVLMGAVVIR